MQSFLRPLVGIALFFGALTPFVFPGRQPARSRMAGRAPMARRKLMAGTIPSAYRRFRLAINRGTPQNS